MVRKYCALTGKDMGVLSSPAGTISTIGQMRNEGGQYVKVRHLLTGSRFS